jgi:hypothetical protein
MKSDRLCNQTRLQKALTGLVIPIVCDKKGEAEMAVDCSHEVLVAVVVVVLHDRLVQVLEVH